MSARLIAKEFVEDCTRVYSLPVRYYARRRRCSIKRAKRIVHKLQKELEADKQ